jgi:hypothetical protein
MSPTPNSEPQRPSSFPVSALCPACGDPADRPGFVSRDGELFLCSHAFHNEFYVHLEARAQEEPHG